MEILENSIRDFFSNLKLISSQWTEKANLSASVFSGLRNQSEQLKMLDKCKWNEKLLEEFPDIKEKLLNKIYLGLEEEVSVLTGICEDLLSLKHQLTSRMDQIDKSAYRQNLSVSSAFGDIAPPLYKLIEHAEDIVRCYTALYLEIECALACIDYKDGKSIDFVEEAFQKSMLTDKTITGYILLWNAIELEHG